MNKKFFLIPLMVSLLFSCGEATNTSNQVTTSEEDESKVDVIILAGQSNAEGNTFYQYLPIDVKTKYEQGFDNVLINYKLTGYSTNNSNNQFIDVTLGQANRLDRFGPEVGMAEKIQEKNFAKPTYIIKFASGGTNLANQWASPSSGLTGSVYNDFEAFVMEAISVLLDQDLTPSIKAFCWMQGESDSDGSKSLIYEKMEEYFINDVNDLLSDYIDEQGMTFIDAGISNEKYPAGNNVWEYYERINNAKKNNQAKDPEHRIYIETNDYNLTTNQEPTYSIDYYHYDAESMVKLGHLFADAILDNNLLY